MSTKLFFCGDVVVSDVKNIETDFLSHEFKNVLANCDVVCCNFEAPIADGLKPIEKVGPHLVNAKEMAGILADVGFNLATLANNHIYDYGKEGIERTIDILEESGISVMGAGVSECQIYNAFIYGDKNPMETERPYGEGKRCSESIAIVNMAENGFGASIENDESGYSYMFHKRNLSLLHETVKTYDTVLAVCHAGAELWEIPLPEWKEFYRYLIDIGVKAVIAHHPHVPQGWEIYKGGLIFYSLGNFAFNKGKGTLYPESYSVILTVDDGKISFEVIPTVFRGGKIFLNENEDFMRFMEERCRALEDGEAYRKQINMKCLQSYPYYKDAYGKVVCVYRGSMRERIKGIVGRLLMGIKFQNRWLYHNIAIETHLYICRRAARLELKGIKI